MWSPSNTPLSYTNWNAGEPNNWSNEDCVMVYWNGKWNDEACTTKNRYVCQTGCPQPSPPPPSPPSLPTAPVVCGRPNMCNEDAGLKAVNELHEVRLQRIHPIGACMSTLTVPRRR